MEKNTNIQKEISKKWEIILPFLDERSRRLWVGMEAHNIGRGGVTLLAKATGVTRKTIAKGVKEILKPKEEKLRKDGGGRKNKKEEY